MKKKYFKRFKLNYKLIAYACIGLVFGLVLHNHKVYSEKKERMATYPIVELRKDPIPTPKPSPKPPTPTPEALMGNVTFTSNKLNISFTYATRVKSGQTTSSLTATEVGNAVYIHEIGKPPTLFSNHFVKVLDKDPRLDLEKAVKFMFLDKPQYCGIRFYEKNEDLPKLRFNITEIARINVQHPPSGSNQKIDYEKYQKWQDTCVFRLGFFAYDISRPDKLLFIRDTGQYGDYVGTNGSNILYSNIIEEDRNLRWYQTLDFLK